MNNRIMIGLGFGQHEVVPHIDAAIAEAGQLPPQPWRVANALVDAGFSDTDVVECEQNNDCYAMSAVEARSCRAAAVYSWSLLTLIDKLAEARKAGPMEMKELLVVCLGVKNPIFAPGFVPPPEFRVVIVFQIADAFPASNDVKGKPSVDIRAVDSLETIKTLVAAQLADGPQAVVNVACRSLWGKIAWFVDMHTKTENDDRVIALIVDLFRTYAAGGNSWQMKVGG